MVNHIKKLQPLSLWTLLLFCSVCKAPSSLIRKYQEQVKKNKNNSETTKNMNALLLCSKRVHEKQIPTDIAKEIIKFLPKPNNNLLNIPREPNPSAEMLAVFEKIDFLLNIIKNDLRKYFKKTAVNLPLNYEINLDRQALYAKYLATIDTTVFDLIHQMPDHAHPQEINRVIERLSYKIAAAFEKELINLYFNGSKSNFKKALIFYQDIFINKTSVRDIQRNLKEIGFQQLLLTNNVVGNPHGPFSSEITQKGLVFIIPSLIKFFNPPNLRFPPFLHTIIGAGGLCLAYMWKKTIKNNKSLKKYFLKYKRLEMLLKYSGYTSIFILTVVLADLTEKPFFNYFSDILKKFEPTHDDN